MTPEEVVKSAWNEAYVYISKGGGRMVQFGSHSLPTWQAALHFTRKRQQEIAEIEEEISAVHDLYGYDHNCLGDVWERILTRLQTQLTELKKGMK